MKLRAVVAGHNVRSAINAVSVLWSGSILGAGVALLCNLYLAHELGPQGFGEFSAALMAATLIAPLAGMGVNSSILRIYGHEGWGGLEWGPAIVRFTLLTTASAVVILVIYACFRKFFGGRDAYLLLILVPVILGQVTLSLVSAKLQLEENYRGVAVWQILGNFLRLICLVAVAMLFEISSPLAALVYSLVALLLAVAAIPHIYSLSTTSLKLRGHGPIELATMSSVRPSVAAVANESWQFGISGFLYLLYYQGPIVLLETFGNAEQAGIYNAAYLILGACYLFPGVVFQKFLLPKLHRWSASQNGRMQQIYKGGSCVMFCVGLLVGGAVALTSKITIGILFQEKFSAAAPVLAVLAVCIPLRFLSSTADAVLTSGTRLREKIRIQCLAAFLCVSLNFLLISRFGIMAAVFITVLCEVVVTCALHKFAYREMISKAS